MATELRVWRVRNRRGWSYGRTVRVPDEFVFLPAGNAGLTRRAKRGARQVLVECKKTKYGQQVLGIWAHREVVEGARRGEVVSVEEPEVLFDSLTLVEAAERVQVQRERQDQARRQEEREWYEREAMAERPQRRRQVERHRPQRGPHERLEQVNWRKEGF
jgi:hypothetical protein